MSASRSAAFSDQPESGAERLVRFSFPVTWSLLSADASGHKSDATSDRKRSATIRTSESITRARVPIPERMVTPLQAEPTAIAVTARSTDPAGDRAIPTDRPGMDRWEMVIPKMNRPAARSSRKLGLEHSPAHTPAEDFSPPQGKRSAARPEAEPPVSRGLLAVTAPESPSANPVPLQSFADAVSKERSGKLRVALSNIAAMVPQRWRSIRQVALIGAWASAVLLAVGFFVFAVKHDLGAPKRDPAPLAVQTGPALLAGPAQWTPLSQWPRRIAVVRGSMNQTDFRLDFLSPVDAKTTGWVFRVRDAKNYYAMRVEIAKPTAASPSAVLKRFAVIDGRDEPMTQILIAIGSGPGAWYKVRTEALGNRFTTWISDRKVDEWTDARLRGGGVGFYSENGEPAASVGDLTVVPLLKR